MNEYKNLKTEELKLGVWYKTKNYPEYAYLATSFRESGYGINGVYTNLSIIDLTGVSNSDFWTTGCMETTKEEAIKHLSPERIKEVNEFLEKHGFCTESHNIFN